MPRLTARGVAFLVAGAALTALAYLLERPELLPVAAIAAGAPLIALALVASSRPQVRVGRQLEPAIATEGEPVRVTVSLTGRARAAEWVERVPMAPGYAGPGRLREVIATRSAVVLYRYWPARRGMPLVGPLLIEDRDPFALALRVTDTRVQVAQLVLPRVTPLPPAPVPDPSTEHGQRTARSRERAADDVVTREYRDGDALRRFHWRVTARQGELAVIELAERVGELDGRPASGAPPVVALAAAPGDATLRWMLAQRSSRAPAVALLVGPPAPVPPTSLDPDPDPDPVLRAFSAAGWRVARVSASTPPDDAWLALLGDPSAVRRDSASAMLVPHG